MIDPGAISGPSIAEARRRLRGLIRDVSLLRGDFILASGERSDFYLDLRRTTTHPEGAFLVAHLLLARVAGLGVDALGGPTLGADPVVGAVALLSHLRGHPLPAFIVRKETKGHGTGRPVEGHLEPGWRVALVDDVVTKAGSLIRAAETVRAAGAEIARVLVIVDRGQGGRERLAAAGLELDALFELAEILDER